MTDMDPLKGMIKMHLLVETEIHDISTETGLPEEFLWNLYNYDQDFGLVTKIVIIPEDKKALKEAFYAGSDYGSVSGPLDDDPDGASFEDWYEKHKEET